MNHLVASAPSYRNLPVKIAGMLLAISPLCVWNFWKTFPSSALLAPLLLAAALAGTARAMKKNVRETFLPIFPAIRLTLAAGLAFTAADLGFQALFNWLPQALVGTATMPPAWLIPLGHLNLLAHFCSLLLLTMAAAYACLLCAGKRVAVSASEKTRAES